MKNIFLASFRHIMVGRRHGCWHVASRHNVKIIGAILCLLLFSISCAEEDNANSVNLVSFALTPFKGNGIDLNANPTPIPTPSPSSNSAMSLSSLNEEMQLHAAEFQEVDCVKIMEDFNKSIRALAGSDTSINMVTLLYKEALFYDCVMRQKLAQNESLLTSNTDANNVTTYTYDDTPASPKSLKSHGEDKEVGYITWKRYPETHQTKGDSGFLLSKGVMDGTNELGEESRLMVTLKHPKKAGVSQGKEIEFHMLFDKPESKGSSTFSPITYTTAVFKEIMKDGAVIGHTITGRSFVGSGHNSSRTNKIYTIRTYSEYNTGIVIERKKCSNISNGESAISPVCPDFDADPEDDTGTETVQYFSKAGKTSDLAETFGGSTPPKVFTELTAPAFLNPTDSKNHWYKDNQNLPAAD